MQLGWPEDLGGRPAHRDAALRDGTAPTCSSRCLTRVTPFPTLVRRSRTRIRAAWPTGLQAVQGCQVGHQGVDHGADPGLSVRIHNHVVGGYTVNSPVGLRADVLGQLAAASA